MFINWFDFDFIVVLDEVTLNGMMTITDQEFTNALLDRNSNEYQRLRDRLRQVKPEYLKS